MLMLRRKLGEEVLITHEGQVARVVILGFRGKSACVGIDAPASMKVMRRELVDRTLAEKKGGPCDG